MPESDCAKWKDCPATLILEEKLKAAENAKDLQAKEYERRLSDLNHAAARQDNLQATFVNKEVYTSHHEILENRVKDLELSRANLEGKASQTSVNIAYLVSVLAVIVSLILKLWGK